MDSHTVAAQTAETAHAEHEHPAFLRHHFESVEQQRESATFGMWLFLLTEIMFFGGLFCAYLIFRNWYYPAFVAGSHSLHLWAGTLNTTLLIISSFTMAMAVHASETRVRKALIGWMIATIILGSGFLCVKAYEWHDEWVEHHVPGLNFSPQGFLHGNQRLSGRQAFARYGGEDAGVLLAILRDDRDARSAHDHRGFAADDPADPGVGRKIRGRPRGAHREFWAVLALCRHCLDFSVSAAVSDQSTSVTRTGNSDQ